MFLLDEVFANAEMEGVIAEYQHKNSSCSKVADVQ